MPRSGRRWGESAAIWPGSRPTLKVGTCPGKQRQAGSCDRLGADKLDLGSGAAPEQSQGENVSCPGIRERCGSCDEPGQLDVGLPTALS